MVKRKKDKSPPKKTNKKAKQEVVEIRKLEDSEVNKEDLFHKLPSMVLVHIFSEYLSLRDKIRWFVFFFQKMFPDMTRNQKKSISHFLFSCKA